MQEHFDDEYVKLSQALGYRSRAAFKLDEIQAKDNIIKPGMNIVDLGAAPGGWSQYARHLMGKNDRLIALDVLPMEPLVGVEFIQGDFREEEILKRLLESLNGAEINLVLSDMAPNMSGNKEIDQPRAMFLAELALDTARTLLARNGVFLVKIFQGAGFAEFHRDVQLLFTKVSIRKPKASRPRSKEVYILAKGFK